MWEERVTLDAVLFDFDFTLGRPLGDLSSAERQTELFRSVGLPYDVAEITRATEERRRRIDSGHMAGRLYPQRMRDLVTAYRQLLRILGYQGDAGAVARELYTAYARLPFLLFDDARPTLHALAELGLRLGIVSNHSPAARPLIESLVGDLVPATHITISGEVGAHKPAPTLFRRGAQRVGVPVARCAFVGDNLVVDAEGAVAAGCGLGVWVDRVGSAAPSLPAYVRRVTRLAELVPLFKAIRP